VARPRMIEALRALGARELPEDDGHNCGPGHDCRWQQFPCLNSGRGYEGRNYGHHLAAVKYGIGAYNCFTCKLRGPSTTIILKYLGLADAADAYRWAEASIPGYVNHHDAGVDSGPVAEESPRKREMTHSLSGEWCPVCQWWDCRQAPRSESTARKGRVYGILK
jgi:hypothetical protein